jgi:methylisocitrate lyase
MDLDARRRAFHQLHSSGCFVMPNPVGHRQRSRARRPRVQSACDDERRLCVVDRLPRQPRHAAERDSITSRRSAPRSICPINADFEGGFAIEPDGVAANVTRAVATGIAGLSIEDSTGNPDNPLFDLPLAVDRIRAARRAIDQAGAGVVLTARSEGFIAGRPDLSQTIARLTPTLKREPIVCTHLESRRCPIWPRSSRPSRPSR